MTREEAEKALRAKRAAYMREWRSRPENKERQKEYQHRQYERRLRKLMEEQNDR